MKDAHQRNRGAVTEIQASVLASLWGELLAEKGELWLTARSGSMAPLITVGDRIRVEATPPEVIRFGHIVVFREGEKLVVHRVVATGKCDRECVFLQKGDCYSLPRRIPASQVLGKVSEVHKLSRRIRLESPRGRFLNLLLAMRSYLACFMEADLPAEERELLGSTKYAVLHFVFTLLILPLRLIRKIRGREKDSTIKSI